jgi:glycosyltransferase involved in cell wall biosynthesis
LVAIDDARAGNLPEALRGRSIVCVGFADWEASLWTNQQHLMSRLARFNRVLFVESLGLRRPQLAGRDLRRMARRLRHGVASPRQVDGVHVVSPLVIPLHASSAVRAVNARILPRQVERAMRGLGMTRPILWGYVPQAEVLLDTVRPSLVVYHCVDDMAAQKGIDAESLRAAERRFAARADLVIASSPALARRMRELSDNVLEAPNVADTALFSRALDADSVDSRLAALPSPRIVFTGAITATKLDITLLEGLARLRPDWTLALVGPVGAGDPSTDVSELAALPNVHLLGSYPYAELPDVLGGAAAGLIPYAQNELTASVFPMKVYEYLAAGLPVVATPLPALEGTPGITFASNAEQTAARLDQLIADDGPERRAERARLAAGHSWDARLEEIGSALERLER